ncbi:hypothetical protein FRC08_017249 [Ceratobasidium sp. 394]|nr:hypothetical protein FRC08_017249 [Ceratobasidium sp. 394]
MSCRPTGGCRRYVTLFYHISPYSPRQPVSSAHDPASVCLVGLALSTPPPCHALSLSRPFLPPPATLHSSYRAHAVSLAQLARCSCLQSPLVWSRLPRAPDSICALSRPRLQRFSSSAGWAG